MNLFTYLSGLIPVSVSLKKAIEQCCEKREAQKGEVLIQKGERCTDLFFIEKGLMRGYYFDEGKEITHWFAREGEFATCFYSFIAHEASQECVQALEDASLVVFPHEALQKLYKDFPETERIGRLLTEHYYLKLEGRLLGIQFKTAKERYQNLLNSDGSLLQRAPLGQVASYLGISQETLSRIRADL